MAERPTTPKGCSCGWPENPCQDRQSCAAEDDYYAQMGDDGDTGEDTNVEDSYAR